MADTIEDAADHVAPGSVGHPADRPPADLDPTSLVACLRATFERGHTKPLAWRDEQLSRLADMLRDHADEFAIALRDDLRKSETEAWTTEIGFSIADVEHQRKHLARWARPRKVSLPVAYRPGSAQVVPEPKGVVLVIAPWNYPLQLVIAPMAAAIAAGNAVVAKPSEMAPATSAAVARRCAEYLDQTAVRVVEGGVETSTALLQQRYDHIFFTGGTRVGTIVMRAAAEHLTPVTLELGGKSPAIVTADADLEVTARRLAWGKFTNAGQTCVAPDYLLVERSVRDDLVSALRTAIEQFYGADPQRSGDFGRIVDDRHFERLAGMIAAEHGGEVAIGGTTDPDTRYIAPTVVVDPHADADMMAEEIFGPILPVLTVDSLDEAVAAVTARPKPLALYVFASDEDADRVVSATSSGAVGVDNTLMHVGVPDLPFGGVGPSGMGAYHGRAGFDTFSHLKSVYRRTTRIDPSIVYPPYTDLKRRLIGWLT